MKKLIQNTPADWIEVEKDGVMSFMILKAVGYPNYTVTHLSKENAIELLAWINESLKFDKDEK